MSDEHDNTPDKKARTLTNAAERALAQTFGGPVRLGEPSYLRDKYRNRVLRCPVAHGPAGAPASVIVKAAVGEGESAFDPAKDDLGDTAWRFFNEWAGTRFLNEINDGDGPALCARLLGADKRTGLLVLEDLGEGACLADRLQGDDPGAATLALLRYAASLGRLHARTVGRENEWRQMRRAAGGSETTREREGVRWLRENVEPLRKQLDALGIAVAPGWDDEIALVQQTFDDPGPCWDAFSPSDTCPDNHRLPEAPGGYLRFFDFEFGGFRHALLDAAYFFAPFPTCWCVNRLPGDLPTKMEAAYRAELARGCSPAGDDARFARDLVHAGAYWTVASVSWSLEQALKADDNDKKWGLSTNRQRHPLRLDNFANLAEERGHLPALAQTARALAGKLRELWPAEDTEMPLYPPFRVAEQAN